MANKALFRSTGSVTPATASNEAGGLAYDMTPEQALAQLAATGTLSQTYYASATAQLDTVRAVADQVHPAFIAKCAIYARERGFMKDMPSLLCAMLAKADVRLLDQVFDRVIDNGRMLRNFVQILRSGAAGRRSLGSGPRRMVRRWLSSRSDEALFRASVGNAPSLADVIKMVHPRPETDSRRALYGYLLDRPHDGEALPQIVRDYEAFKAGHTQVVPDVEFRLLTSLQLTSDHWAAIARRGRWHQTRMNLNAYGKHGVFELPGMAELIAEKLRDAEAIQKAKVFPYQLLMAYKAASGAPRVVREALQDAMELALSNVPELPGKVYVFPDISGSMSSPVTGQRRGGTSAVTCRDVAALVASALLRKNPSTVVVPFHDEVERCELNPRDTVMTNADKLAKLPSGGTNCSAPLAMLNQGKLEGDLVVYVSDNESWVDSAPRQRQSRGTATLQQWERFKKRSPGAKLVCVDIQPYVTTQAHERQDVLNVGGFSDAVFTVIADFVADRLRPDHWVGVIDETDLGSASG